MNILKPYTIELAPTLSQHWYHVWQVKKPRVNLKKGDAVFGEMLIFKKGRFLGTFPSATTILNAYPQSPHLTRWIADQGWNEAQAIKSAAGERGTTIHKGIEWLLDGNELREGYMLPGGYRALSVEEYWKLSTFVSWYNEYKPTIIAKEMRVFSKKGGYAGTLDALIEIGGQVTIIDWKSSSSIHEHFPLQFAAYAYAIEEMTDLKIEQTACLQLGAQNKQGYRYVVYPSWREHYKVFEHVRATWQYDQFDSKQRSKEPPVLILPPVLKLDIKT